ncbi:molybdenum ABC transporter ATP-binding protein [Acuticoccus mangrovi]|uniref:Molybdenum ABC transporter ATP-binding protein n=1 Tax=Acuticoccus mangrovi TaxID=2796142 RepID=A0A934IR12_9HYPH|nr:molybdenum ABC transporter ATP-binding protein [Acuticoccus mangrovi]MBJ3776692.1 molybdenum ABC transporter ATP-binding protein [Acuticoccus mangrovi]
MSLTVRLRHAFGGFTLDVAFEAPAGITALFGRSGSGKTTIVNAVAGLMRPDEGRIVAGDTVLLDTAAGRFVPPHRRRVGYVFQEGRLFPHLSVRQNLLFGAFFAPRGAPREDLGRVVDLLGIAHLLGRRPGMLSGGEKSRVAIGRALLAAPRLLLMDEPLAALDEARKAEIIPYLERLRDETEVPILYVSHSLPEVARLATSLVAIDAGRVVRAGSTTTVLADPAAVPVLGHREAGAILTARVVRHHADGLTELAASAGPIYLPTVDAPLGATVRVRIEAHDVIIAREPPSAISALNVLPVMVTEIAEGSGPGAAVGLQAGEDRLLARITRRSVGTLGLAPGVACYAILKSTSVARRDVGAGDRAV